jgi:hypothetical protein
MKVPDHVYEWPKTYTWSGTFILKDGRYTFPFFTMPSETRVIWRVCPSVWTFIVVVAVDVDHNVQTKAMRNYSPGCSFISVFKFVRKTAKSGYYLFHICLSVCPVAWNNSAPTGRIFMKFDIWVFFEKICRENSGLIIIWQEYQILYMKINVRYYRFSLSSS